jgi:carbon-monoxide dehydrogenase medium subunit
MTGVTLPLPKGGYAYQKQKRKIGDYATAAAAVMIVKEGDTCVSASVAMTNLSDTPIYSEAAGAALVGTSVDDAALKAAVTAMLGDIDPSEDNRGPVAFKNHVAGVILRRTIELAWSRA